MSKTILVTGGAGFIGSAVVRHLINDTDHTVINLDKLTYAGNLESLTTVSDSDRYSFEKVDICDADEVKRVFTTLACLYHWRSVLNSIGDNIAILSFFPLPCSTRNSMRELSISVTFNIATSPIRNPAP